MTSTPGARTPCTARNSAKLSLLVAATLFFSSTFPALALAQTVSFAARRDFIAGTNPHAVAAGDFNRDGVQDLAVANLGDNTVSVLLGNGDGTFRPASAPPVSAGSSPQSMVVGDFNGDGRPDLAVADYGANVVSVLLGNGNGTFRPAATTSGTGNGPWALAVADFDGDGKLDLVVANMGDVVVSVLLGKGDGTFQQEQTFRAGSGPSSVAVGDFNGDGVKDLAVTNYGDSTVSVLLGSGTGARSEERRVGKEW